MKRIQLLLLSIVLFAGASAQKLSLSGYIKDMQGFYYLENAIRTSPTESFQWTTYNLVHNRLNLEWQPVSNLRFEVGVRNRLMVGKLIKDFSGYAGSFEKEDGLQDLSWNLADQKNWFINTSIDRVYIDYTWKQFQLRTGRQRINWGINLVWNPNDLFNAFSYMDFDYEERPGSDAVLFTWYSSGTSSMDVAFKTDSSHNLTAATRFIFNYKGYDIQLLCGKNGYDFVVGGGWSGSIGDVSFRGESTFFTPFKGNEDASKTSVSATVSADYTFYNSLFIHSAFLFNSMGTTSTGTGFSLLDPNFSLSAKKLSIGKYEVFGQVSYPVNPILNVSFASMFNPSDLSSYLGPTATISLHDNIELMLTAQVLLGDANTEYGLYGNTYAGYGRLRWSF